MNEKHLRVGVITSSFWAKTLQRAGAILDGLPLLAELTLSADTHHADFVPPRFVKNAYIAAQERGIKAKVRICVQKPVTKEDDILTDFIRDFCDKDNIEIQQIIPYGRAAENSEFSEQIFDDYEHCPAIGPHVYYNGDVIPCCNSIVPLRGRHPLWIGSIEDTGSLKERVVRNAFFLYLKVWGAKVLIEMIYGAGARGKNACDLCATACSDTAAWEKISQVVNAAETRALTLAFALRHFDVAEAEQPLKEAIEEIINARSR